MKTLSSVEVQNRFGSIANIVKSAEPVAVTQYGTLTLMILPRDKFEAWRPNVQQMVWVRLFRDAVIFVESETAVTECRAPEDNKFLELALSANADVLEACDIH